MARKYGLREEKTIDYRDIPLTMEPPRTLPATVDLRPRFPVLNQEFNDCLVNTGMSQVRDQRIQIGLPDMMPSRNFNYWLLRQFEGDTDKDEGGELRDVYKALNKFGYCPEDLWQYNSSTLFEKPSQEAFDAAVGKKLHNYANVNTRNILACKQCLAHGIAFSVGFLVPQSFEGDQIADPNNATLVMPPAGFTPIGGHGVSAVGYIDIKQVFIILNSWGDKWGAKGFFYMPYEFMASGNVIDAWALRMSKTGLL